MDAQLDFKAGIKDVMPTVFGYIGVGLAFGIVAHTSHLSVWLVLLMSLIVYAGSAQFVITSMLLTGSPIGAIVVSTLLINARMSLMYLPVATGSPPTALFAQTSIISRTSELTIKSELLSMLETGSSITTILSF